jgi:lysozyme
MIASPNAYKLIKQFEGLRLEAYLCAAGKLTIGWGHCKSVKAGDTINEAQAETFLKEDVAAFESQLLKALNADAIEINQGQFDALICFAFNLGTTNLINSTLWQKLKQDNFAEASKQFTSWIYAKRTVKLNGKNYTINEPLRGLCARRLSESSLFDGDLKIYPYNHVRVNEITIRQLQRQIAKEQSGLNRKPVIDYFESLISKYSE